MERAAGPVAAGEQPGGLREKITADYLADAVPRNLP
jgi:hypothetical protein